MRVRIVAVAGVALSALALALSGCGSSGTSRTAASGATRTSPAASATSTASGSATASQADPQTPAPATRLASITVSVPRANATGPLATPHTLEVPAGWKVEAWARVPAARYETWTPEHDLLVSASSTGRIVELIPGPSASTPPRQRVLASGLSEPQGMAFDTFDGHEVLYVAEDDQLNRFIWNANGTLGARTILVKDLLNPRNPGDHFAKTLAIGPDHTIYMTGGSFANVGTADLSANPERAVIYTVNPTTHALGIYATGIRNGEGLAFAPDGTLWTAVNERDNIAYPFHRAYGGMSDAYGKVIQSYVDTHPPDEVTRLTRGINLGWPYCDPDPDVTPGAANSALDYTNMHFDADAQFNHGGRRFNCAALAPIKLGIPAHSAPLGFHFLAHSALPARWRDGAILVVHGSWDSKPVQRAPAVLWMPWNATTHTLEPAETLISGFQTTASGERWGRVVDALPGPDGDLYVSDDQSGTIYRVSP